MTAQLSAIPIVAALARPLHFSGNGYRPLQYLWTHCFDLALLQEVTDSQLNSTPVYQTHEH
jgi:hypothetical protein